MLAPVDLNLLNLVWQHMEGRVTYRLGAKAPSLTCDTSLIKQIDCSGFTRYAIARATNQQVILPDGSQAQREWATANLHPFAYDFVGSGPALYIAFLSPPEGADWPRHVWLVRQSWTRESCGSQGVTARPWNNPKLVDASACFVLPYFK